ncbi:hypothetical protein [Pseudomonas fluorescens]|uniref:hypothetical protein n=1 Tax=Pseudomonas fluorescens TaxID=294 RepID=UPI003CFDA898
MMAMKGVKIASLWKLEVPATFARRRRVSLELGKSWQIILSEIFFAHYRQGVVDECLHVDPQSRDAIARLEEDPCATTRDRFEILTPVFAP